MLLGLETIPELHKLVFILVATAYVVSIIGNFMVIVIIQIDSRLHTPMYFFLMNLALIEILYTTAITPNTLKNLLEKDKRISFSGCFIQMFVFITLGGSECVLLGTMAYDRYIAICHPLYYSTIMNQSLCINLALICWTIGLLNSLVHTILTSRLSYCNDRLIKHYFCEIPPLLKIACKDTTVNELVVFLVGGCVIVGSLILTLVSYVFVIDAVMVIPGLTGKQKAFSTCTSHLVVVTIFFGTVIFTYLRPTSHSSTNKDHVISLTYSVLTPLINPIIYSYRNKDFQKALEKTLQFVFSVKMRHLVNNENGCKF
ncbi:olfactory receptor 2G3-like [Discoglossus pictus]